MRIEFFGIEFVLRSIRGNHDRMVTIPIADYKKMQRENPNHEDANMITADLLAALREKDPDLWEKIAETALSEYGYHDEEFNEWISNAITYTDLFGPAQEAWLQHCLQDAIRARGWHLYQIRNDDLPGLPCFADIIILGHGKEHDIRNEGEGSTESEALLRAYLAAIQEAA